MTKLEIGIKFKNDANALRHVGKSIYDYCANDVINEIVYRISTETCTGMEDSLNQFERVQMSLRRADPVLGHINTAMWDVTFATHMHRHGQAYGTFRIINKQPPQNYFYTNDKSFPVGRRVKRNIFPIRQKERVWRASGQVENLAMARYSLGNQKGVGIDYWYDTRVSNMSSQLVYPKKKKALMFYSHKHGALIVRYVRFYRSGGHERYHVTIDNIVRKHIENLPDDVSTYKSTINRKLYSMGK